MKEDTLVICGSAQELVDARRLFGENACITTCTCPVSVMGRRFRHLVLTDFAREQIPRVPLIQEWYEVCALTRLEPGCMPPEL